MHIRILNFHYFYRWWLLFSAWMSLTIYLRPYSSMDYTIIIIMQFINNEALHTTTKARIVSHHIKGKNCVRTLNHVSCDWMHALTSHTICWDSYPAHFQPILHLTVVIVKVQKWLWNSNMEISTEYVYTCLHWDKKGPFHFNFSICTTHYTKRIIWIQSSTTKGGQKFTKSMMHVAFPFGIKAHNGTNQCWIMKKSSL